MGVSAVLKNTGKADATNFAWSIKSDGTVFVGKEKAGTATLAAGASTTIKTGFMLGIGAITITVTADTAVKTAEAKTTVVLRNRVIKTITVSLFLFITLSKNLLVF